MNASIQKNLTKLIERPYQSNIIEVCKNRNSIVFLPTGAGKSFIAFQVIKHFSYQLEKPYSEGGKRSFFLTTTQVLAKQQAEAARNVFTYNIAVITGEQNVDAFNESEWLKYLNENEILVMTAQCFYDGVSRQFIKLDQVNVLVMDECHHARKGHVFRQIMQKFEGIDMNHCRIIGLSGILIGVDNSTKPYVASEEMRQLEITMQSTIISVNNAYDQDNSDFYGTKPQEIIVHFMKQPNDPCVQMIHSKLELLITKVSTFKIDKNITYLNKRSLLETSPNYIRDLNSLFKDVIYQMEEMGAYGGFLTLLSVIIQLELLKRTSSSEKYRNMIKFCISTIEEFVFLMKEDLNINAKDAEVIKRNSSPKINLLIEILLESFCDIHREKDLQCLVFTKRRSTAKALYHLITYFGQYSGENFPIKADFVIGQNAELPNEIENIVNQKFNKNSIEKFTNKETNCIFCTNVLEEGIDLQMCNLVIMYDKPDTFRSYMQSRGRARDNNSKYCLMVEKNEKLEKKFVANKNNWNAIHQVVKKELIGKTVDREEPSEEEIQAGLEQPWEPYTTRSGSELTASNSIAILNQYIQSIPTDRFTVSPIDYRRIDIALNKIQVGIRLPLSSQIQNETISDVMINVRLAKQHACFKTVIKLHEIAEITDSLTPYDSSQKIEMFDDFYFGHLKKHFESDTKKAGTKKNLRIHPVKVPDVLVQSSPIVNGFSFLYPFKITPLFDSQNLEHYEAFFKLLNNGKGYAILTSNRIPKLCKMSFFPSFGRVDCDIGVPPHPVTIDSEEQLRKLRKFQMIVFRDVLNAWKTFYVIDKSAFIIVPIDENNQIDWKLVNDFQSLSPRQKISSGVARTMTFDVNDYLNKIITPSYRCADNYVVYKVHKNLTPLTKFPEDFASTYKEYYYNKWELNVTRDDQFLIEVKAISGNWNLLFPGSGSSGENVRSFQKLNNQKEFLIPELCHNFKFPADYWLKALLLPCIMHRISYMLLAEELRKKLIDDEIDNGKGIQKYVLDIDYGNYDAREKQLNENEKLEDSLYRLSEEVGEEKFLKLINEMKKDLKKKKATPMKITLDGVQLKLPTDLNRNWLGVTEEDINYYCRFIQQNSSNENIKKFINHIETKFKSSSKKAIKDSEKREKISLLFLDSNNSCVQQKDLIKVITTSNSGDVFDMERYETLGDAFLKFIVSLFLFKKHEKWHEGHLTALKGRLVSNRTLYYVGINYGLQRYLKTSKFNIHSINSNKYIGLAPSTTLPENCLSLLRNNRELLINLFDLNELKMDEVESGILSDENLQLLKVQRADANIDCELIPNLNEQYIGDKIIADAVEALLGCVISSVGIEAAVKLCDNMKILPNENGFLENLLKEKIPPRVHSMYDNGIITDINNRELLEKTIGYKFKDLKYLRQALTHSSYPIKIAGSYEQLEFLGDAILDFLITSYISEQCPKMSPGELTDLRSALVNNSTLACIIVRNDLHKFMFYENHALAETIKKFVDYQRSVEFQVTDQIILLDTEDESCTSAESIDIPKSLGDIFESIVGAIFLDSDLSLETTWATIYKLMKNEILQFMADVPMQIVRRLYEFNKGSAKPRFYKHETIQEDNSVAVPLKFTCKGEEKFVVGFGKNKDLARKAAAKRALNDLIKA